MNKKIVVTAAFLVMFAILLGAFGAHGLKGKISVESIATFEVGIRYQFFQGLALLVLGLNASAFDFSLKYISGLMIAGILFFSLSIYFLATQQLFGANLKFLGPITPIGGLLMILGWLVFIVKLIQTKKA